jgi:hypothetical protein
MEDSPASSLHRGKISALEEMQTAWFDRPASPRCINARPFSCEILCRMAHFLKSPDRSNPAVQRHNAMEQTVLKD